MTRHQDDIKKRRCDDWRDGTVSLRRHEVTWGQQNRDGSDPGPDTTVPRIVPNDIPAESDFSTSSIASPTLWAFLNLPTTCLAL